MAWIFSLSAECGGDEHRAKLFAEHFNDLSFDLMTGKTSVCQSRTQPDVEGNWWAIICPGNITQSGCTTLDDAIELSELGFRLYRHLMSAPPFRYAIAGVEVDEFRLYSELPGVVAVCPNGRRALLPHLNGLVLRRDIWEGLGKPLGFSPFGAGYSWMYYQGETYSPLQGNREYTHKLHELRSELPFQLPEDAT